MHFSKFRNLITSFAAVAMTAATATHVSASVGHWFKQAASTLPVESAVVGSGHLGSIRAHETADRLYVTGRARQPHATPHTHVDVQLLRANARVIAQGRDDIGAAQPKPGGGKRLHDSFAVSFPLSDAREADRIRVVYHTGNHSSSEG